MTVKFAIYLTFFIVLEFKFLQEKIKQVFDNLIQLDHVNIVKFHAYWIDDKQPDNRKVRSKKFSGIIESINEPCVFFVYVFSGDLYHRVHVVWFVEAVSEENEAEQ